MLTVKNINQTTIAILSWVAIVLINFFQLIYVKYAVPEKFNWQDVFYYPITSLTIGILLIYIWLLPLFKRIRLLKIGVQIPLFIIHGLSYTIIYIILIFFQIALWSDNLALDSFYETVHKFFYTDFHNIAKNYFFLLAIYIAVEYINKREKVLLRQKELEYQVKEVKLQSLESKLHPHFLFNALSSITALIKENPDKAQQMIVELSDLLRFSLEGNMQQLITIKEEINLLEKYTHIEKMRYENQLEVSINIDQNVENKKISIPPLILQPLVENAIIHGFKGHQQKLIIEIKIDKNKITVNNNGAKLNDKFHFGTGLSIVQQRLQFHFDQNASLHLFQNKNQVVAEIKGIHL